MAAVTILCRDAEADRIIPRFSRYLRDNLGWQIVTAANGNYGDALYLSGYYEAQIIKAWPTCLIGAYFTHREEEPPDNAKAKLFDNVARRVGLRIATAKMYADPLREVGLTIQAHPPIERERFTIPGRNPGAGGIVCGVSGFTYGNHRKGEDLVTHIVNSKVGQSVEWRASGRGWPVPTKSYKWVDMPGFYQGLDILVCTARVEGVPMPVLEALSCGVSVVVPRGVGLIDELPDLGGIHRYGRGDVKSLLAALTGAIQARQDIYPDVLRDVTEPYTVAAWCDDHKLAFEKLLDESLPVATVVPIPKKKPVRKQVARGWRGIYCVAFGDPAREVVAKMMRSAKEHMPDIPIALCAAKAIGIEDTLIIEPDSDVGGRRAKLRAYELSPASWQSVLYLDADTEIIKPVYQYFDWIERGWDFVICKDPPTGRPVGNDIMRSFMRKGAKPELDEIEKSVGTLDIMQLNGGVFAFGRNERTEAFFRRWMGEWEKFKGRDQGALIRALYSEPMRILMLGNEWNTFPVYSRGITTAGILHRPGGARRWGGALPDLVSPQSWEAVRKFERQRGRK